MSTLSWQPSRGRLVAVTVVPVLAALVLGLLTSQAPLATGALVLGGTVGAALVLRAEWTLLLYVAVAPFESYLLGIDGRATKALSALLVLAWLVHRLRFRREHSLSHPVTWSTVAFTVVLLVSTVVHANPDPAAQVVISYLGFVVALLVVADFTRNEVPAARVMTVYVASCTVAAVCGLFSWVVLDENRVGGPIEDPNDFAFFLLVAAPLCVGLIRAGARRAWAVPALVVILLAIGGTLSRGALVGLVALVLFAVLAGFVRTRAVVAGVLCVGVAAGVFALAFPERVETSLSAKEGVASQNVDERYALWQVAGEMTLAHPLFGVGPAGFRQERLDYLQGYPLEGADQLDVVHNMYLETSSELGVPGVLALVAVLGSAVVSGVSRWRADRDPLAAALACSLVGASAAAVFLSEQYFLPIWLLAGLAVSVSPLPVESKPGTRLVRDGRSV